MKKLPITLALAVLFLTSCKNSEEDILPKGDFENGILISGEGSGAGTGSISYVSNDFTITDNLIFKDVNNLELGTFLQSVAFDSENAFIVVDNQNTITVADRFTFEKRGEITTDLSTPRFMAIAGNKGYVTNWGSTASATDDFIAVVDLLTLTVESTIPVGNGPERIIERDNKLYVSHKGAFTTNNIISVIDITSKEVKEVTVKDNPDEMYFNSAGQLIALSSGRTIFDADFNVIGNTLGSIATIDTTSLSITNELVFELGEHPSLMVLENNTLYYNLGSKIYAIPADATSLATSEIITAEGFLYGFEVEGDNLFTLNANFSDVSDLNVYSIATKLKTQTKEVALGASKIYFN
ncbi:DUF5074 domain-containing protein [uncultured Polaribacter sp.]|uniref:YncE family protein n=1 Tax=uncultured Polaribacter sp. TaxID=174711 RepID=UPI0026377FFB|nr:DUF5074 domain-containing protein [uncultured Polaribacter sp.]